ncbi:myelin and lymphocyte protein-like [Neolamprologus brichardi]|uniref:myelin and lymphocyte protein-like n=1 Tax=Neolamprologus brichardi TaxID=32507 RepID=UPI001643B55F|nr:myelin and lymphocyte protein-like [Neolamprologus brichardi]
MFAKGGDIKAEAIHPRVFGGLVWILVASAKVDPANPLGWVMFVSIFCFIMTTLWFFIFLCGGNQSSIWPALVMSYVATLLYFLHAIFSAIRWKRS